MCVRQPLSEGLPRYDAGHSRRIAGLHSGEVLAQVALDRGKAAAPAVADAAGVEFFEKRVRPILSARCQGCHGPAKQKGGLRLDARETAIAGGATGPAVVPGNPSESLLVDAINYGENYQMPPKSKLPPEEIATLTEWVQRGAPWGIGPQAVGGSAGQRQDSGRALEGRIPGAGPVLELSAAIASDAPAREAIARRLGAQPDRSLHPGRTRRKRPGPRARGRQANVDPPALLRPDRPAARARRRRGFPERSRARCLRETGRQLLASPHYGERWARHWLDLVRYAETAGHEFDYEIPNAFRYRDYMIRALNLDVPYDQLVIEHTGGDALENPRRHPVEGFNESILGAGFFTLGEGTHSPVDIREEQMRRIDNQIDVFSKTFLGLTLACARCHDHKFDPITTKDYYALAGYLVSSRHQQAFIDAPDRIGSLAKDIRKLKEKLMAVLAEARAALPQSLRAQAEALSASRVPSQPSQPRPATASVSSRALKAINSTTGS